MELGALYSVGLQQPPDAIDAYRKAVEINPRNFSALEALEKSPRPRPAEPVYPVYN